MLEQILGRFTGCHFGKSHFNITRRFAAFSVTNRKSVLVRSMPDTVGAKHSPINALIGLAFVGKCFAPTKSLCPLCRCPIQTNRKSIRKLP